jgi:hypothetical protein
MSPPRHPAWLRRVSRKSVARAIEAILLVALLCWTGFLAARVARGGLPGTIRAAGPAGATGRMVFSDRAEAAVEARGRGLVLWWKESPVPLTREQARELAGVLLAPRSPAAPATLVAGEWSFRATDPPGGTGAFRLVRRIGDAAEIGYAITGADAAEIARLLYLALGGR